MARQTQLVELDLRSGVLSNESGFAVGPKLRLSQNAMWQNYVSLDDIRRRIMSMPSGIQPTPIYTLPNGTHSTAYRILASVAAEDILPSQGFLTAMETGTNHFLIYNAKTGALMSDTGTAVGDQLTASGSIAYWPDISTPTVYMSHPGLGKIYQSTTFGTTQYTATDPPGDPYEGNAAMIVHLDRLWLSKNRFLWFTDPIDPTKIRSTNFARFDDHITSLFRASSSPIDAGAGAHLVIGLRKAVWVIDGDPTYGNGIQRRLVTGAGIADQRCVCETAYGAVCLLTDGQFYLIPSGAQTIEPIGMSVRDLVRNFQFGSLTTSMEWHAPYVYIMFADLNLVWILDFTAGLSGPPKWWGPITSPTGSLEGCILPPVDRAGEMFLAASTNQAPLKVYEIKPSVDTASRVCKLTTGYVQNQGHKVEIRKVVIETVRTSTPTVVKCRAHLADGTTVGFGRPASQTDAVQREVVGKTVFDFSIQPLVSEYVWFDFEWPSGAYPDIHRIYAEIRVQPRQDA
jgi:hypothetical protein